MMPHDSVDVIFWRIVRAWQQHTGEGCNFNMNIGFQRGNVTDPDISCLLVVYNYSNTFTGTMTHENGRPLDPPVTGDWYALRNEAVYLNDTEAPQFVIGWGDTIPEAMLDAEEKLHARFGGR